MIAVYLALMIPLGALSQYFDEQGADNNNLFNFGLMIDQALIDQGALAVVVVLGVFVIGLLAHYWLYAAMTKRTNSPGFGRFWPYLGIYILGSLAIGFGLILVIVPGIILAIRWTPLIAVVIDRDDRAMDSFGDSWDMTRGHGWSLFGAVLILVIALIAVGAVVGGMTVVLGEGSIANSVLAAAVEAVGSAVYAAFAVGAYRLMRDDREQLAEVFE